MFHTGVQMLHSQQQQQQHMQGPAHILNHPQNGERAALWMMGAKPTHRFCLCCAQEKDHVHRAAWLICMETCWQCGSSHPGTICPLWNASNLPDAFWKSRDGGDFVRGHFYPEVMPDVYASRTNATRRGSSSHASSSHASSSRAPPTSVKKKKKKNKHPEHTTKSGAITKQSLSRPSASSASGTLPVMVQRVAGGAVYAGTMPAAGISYNSMDMPPPPPPMPRVPALTAPSNVTAAGIGRRDRERLHRQHHVSGERRATTHQGQNQFPLAPQAPSILQWAYGVGAASRPSALPVNSTGDAGRLVGYAETLPNVTPLGEAEVTNFTVTLDREEYEVLMAYRQGRGRDTTQASDAPTHGMKRPSNSSSGAWGP